MKADYKQELRTLCTIMGIDSNNPSVQGRRIIELFDLIFPLLTDKDEKYTLHELMDDTGYDYEDSFARQKASATVRNLHSAGVLNRTEENHKAFFQVAESYITKATIIKEAENITSADQLTEKLYSEESINDIDFDVDKIKNNKKNLLKYIQHIVHLETNIYALKERYTLLLTERIQTITNGFDDYLHVDSLFEQKAKELQADIDRLIGLASTPPALTNEITVPRPERPVKPCFTLTQPREPLYTKPGFFNKKRVESENAALKANYENELSQYNTAYQLFQHDEALYQQSLDSYTQTMAECDQREKELNQELYVKKSKEYELQKDNWLEQSEVKKKELEAYLLNTESEKNILLADSSAHQHRLQIEYEIQYLESQLKKNIQAQNKLYSYGVIYGKYRNYIAMSSFCDYLMSGRCTSLEGADGAYNLYEQESRADIVINKLDVIVTSLEQIKQNQYFIYNELQTTNSALALINGQLLVNNILQTVQIEQLDDIIANTEQTAYNTQVGAFYAKKNAELTDALGFMVAL